MVKRKKKVAREVMHKALRCYPSTLSLIRIAADAEGVTQSALVDALVRQYVVERGLEKPVAQLVAHAEASRIQRSAWEVELRRQWEQEHNNESGV